MTMSRFEKWSVGLGVLTGFVAAVAFVTATIRDYKLSVDAEKRDWAKSSIIGIFEGNDQLSFKDLYKEFSTTVVEHQRNDMTEDELRRALLGLMETDVVAYNSERNYFLKREPFFESEEKQSEQQKELLSQAAKFAAEAATERFEVDEVDELSAVSELETRIQHVLEHQHGRLSRDELAAQTDRYFEQPGRAKRFSFGEYARHILKMMEVGKLYSDEQGKIWPYDPSILRNIAGWNNSVQETGVDNLGREE